MDTTIELVTPSEDTHLRLLHRVGQECFGVLDRETLTSRITHLLGEYVGSTRVAIGLCEGGELHFISYGLGCVEEYIGILPNVLALDETSLCGWTVTQRQSALVTSPAADSRQRYVPAFHDTVAELAVPIPSNSNQVQGVIDIQTTDPNHTLEHARPVIELVAQKLGLALDNLSLHVTNLRRNRYAALVETIRQRADQHLDSDVLMQSIVTIITVGLPFRSVALYLIEHNQLALRASSLNYKPASHRPLPAAVRSQLSPYGPPYHQALQTLTNSRSISIDVALTVGTTLLGVLNVVTMVPLSPQEINLLIEFAQSLGQVLERNRLFNSMYAGNERSTLFARIVSLIRQSLNIRDTIADVNSTLGRGLNVDFCTVALMEHDNDLRFYGTYRMLISPDQHTATDALLHGELTTAIQQRKHCIANNALEDPQFSHSTHAALQTLNIAALVWIPLQVNGQWLGTLCIYKLYRPYRWSLDELRLLTDVADQLALAFRQLHVYEAERQRRRELEALQEIIRSIGGELSLTALCQKVAGKVIDVFNISAAAVLMANASNTAMEVVASAGFSPPYAASLTMTHQTVQDWIKRFPPPVAVYIPDVRYDAMAGGDAAYAEGLSSLFAQPLMVDGVFSGWLQMYSRGAIRDWSNDECHLAASIAQQIAQAIHTARRYENEHLLRTDAEQSYHQLRAVLTELEQTRERLLRSEKLRSLGELASGVAHDFNNLLASILGNTQILLMDELVGERREALRMIERAAKDGAVTVRRIQEFARSSETVYNDVVDIQEVVKVGLEFTRPSWRDGAQQRGIKFEIVADLKPVHVMGSEAELREVFVNLLVNAVDAMAGGGKITVTSGTKNEWAYFSVTDSGKGVSAENRTRIFDPFFTTKGIGEGTGMGLAVALSVMQRHGGTLHVDEVKPHGARFIAIMPRHHAALVEQRPVVVTRPQSQSILVVDDELSVRQVVARVLSHDKHTVSVATSAEEALDLLSKQTFHIIISDLGMPGMNGWDLLAQARALYPEIATVLMTGWGYQYDTMTAQSRGVDLVLPKPFEMQDLRKAIADLSGATAPEPKPAP